MIRKKTGIATLLLTGSTFVPTAFADDPPGPLTLSSSLDLFPAFSQHDKRGPLPIQPLYDLDRLPGDWLYKRDEWDPSAISPGLGALGSVVNTSRPVVTGFGMTDNGEARQAFVDVKKRAGAFMIRGTGTYSWAGSYQDANGDTVRAGYGRDTEKIVLSYTPDRETHLKAIVIRDEIRDNELAEGTIHTPTGDLDIGADSLKTTRYVGRLIFDKGFEGTLEGLHADTRILVMDRHNNNFEFQDGKQAGQQQDANIERRAVEANVWGDMRIGETPVRIGASGLFETHDGDFATGLNLDTLSSIQYPDVNRIQTGLFAESAFDLGPARLDVGLRWDQATTSVDRADETVSWLNTTGTKTASSTTTRALYTAYYGEQDTDRTIHGVSAVAKVSDSWLDDALKGYLSAGRISRLPDNQELYFARYHAQSVMRAIGNPGLDAETHYRIEAGASYDSAGWQGFGRKSPTTDEASYRFAATLFHDYVDDFISRDRASDNALIWRNVDARFTGATLSAEWNLTRTFSTGVYGRVTWAENLDDDRGLYGIAPAEAVFLADYHDRLGTLGTWNAGIKVRAVADPSDADDDISTGTGLDPEDISGFAVLDVYGAVQLHDRVGLRMGVSNILDTEYAELDPHYVTQTTNPGPINAPGRTFFMWMVMNF